MGDYTPDIRKVRARYAQIGSLWDDGDPGEAFDRFMRKVKADAVREAADATARFAKNIIRPEDLYARAKQIEDE